jgi:hypothetical protein
MFKWRSLAEVRKHLYIAYMIRRELDNEIIFGKVIVNKGYILCSVSAEEALVIKLDNICKLKLDYGIHDRAVSVFVFHNERICLN